MMYIKFQSILLKKDHGNGTEIGLFAKKKMHNGENVFDVLCIYVNEASITQKRVLGI